MAGVPERIADMVGDSAVIFSNGGWPTIQYTEPSPEGVCQFVAKTPYGPVTMTVSYADGYPWQAPSVPEAVEPEQTEV